MHKIFYLLTAACLLQNAVNAQLKQKHFWPATTSFSIKNLHLNKRDKEPDIYSQFKMNECIEGNCDNGEGTWAVAYARKIDFRSNGYAEVVVSLFKGRFTENGKKFTGKKLEYTYTLDGSDAKNDDFYASKFTPRKTENLAEDMAKPMRESRYIVAEGETIFDSTEYNYDGKKNTYIRKYLLHGTGATREAMFKAGASSLQGEYNRGRLTILRAVMQENFPAKSFTGRMDARNNILAGRLEYKDGTVYEGFFRENNYYGPGRLTTANGKIVQGYWERGRLRDSIAVSLPAGLWDISGNAEAGMKEAGINLFGTVTKGKYIGGMKNNVPDGMGFFMTDANTWYAGGFTNGEPSGAGYYYRFTDEPKSGDWLYQRIWVYTGLFNSGYLADGLMQQDQYDWTINKAKAEYSLGYRLKESITHRGTFVKNKLQGCGEYRRTDHRWGSSTVVHTGNFENGQLRGWGTIEQPGVNVAGKLKKFTGFFPEKSLIGFSGERTDMHGYAANVSLLGNTPEHFTQYTKELTNAINEFKNELSNIGLRAQSCPSAGISEKEKQDYIVRAQQILAGMESSLATHKKSGPPTRVFSNAECEANKAGMKFSHMAVLTDRATGTKYIVLDYFCQTKTYLLYPFSSYISNFKSRYSNSSDLQKQVSLAAVNSSYIGNGYFTVCSKCAGTGHVDTWVSGGQEGGWEKWTDNVYYNRPSTAYSYRARVGCGTCKANGWWVQ